MSDYVLSSCSFFSTGQFVSIVTGNFVMTITNLTLSETFCVDIISSCHLALVSAGGVAGLACSVVHLGAVPSVATHVCPNCGLGHLPYAPRKDTGFTASFSSVVLKFTDLYTKRGIPWESKPTRCFSCLHLPYWRFDPYRERNIPGKRSCYEVSLVCPPHPLKIFTVL
jgi:hypothetical protein